MAAAPKPYEKHGIVFSCKECGWGGRDKKIRVTFICSETIQRNKFCLSLLCAACADSSPPLANRHSVRAVAVPRT